MDYCSSFQSFLHVLSFIDGFLHLVFKFTDSFLSICHFAAEVLWWIFFLWWIFYFTFCDLQFLLLMAVFFHILSPKISFFIKTLYYNFLQLIWKPHQVHFEVIIWEFIDLTWWGNFQTIIFSWDAYAFSLYLLCTEKHSYRWISGFGSLGYQPRAWILHLYLELTLLCLCWNQLLLNLSSTNLCWFLSYKVLSDSPWPLCFIQSFFFFCFASFSLGFGLLALQ